jgi:hypothetical protein
VSPPESTEAPRPGIYVAKPKPDVYTVLLAIALVALLIGVICLVLELVDYGGQVKPPPVSMLPSWMGGEVLRPFVRC